MAGGAALLRDRRRLLADAVVVLRELHTVLVQCGNDDLAGLAGELAEVRALAGAQLVAVVAEAETRGVIDQSQHACTSGWVADSAWHSRREAPTIAKAATLLRRPGMEPVADAVLTADIDPSAAVVVAAEFNKLAPNIKPEARPLVLELMLTAAAEHGPGQVRRLREHILATWGEQGEFDDHTERCRRYVELSAGREVSPGVWQYDLTVDGEGRAVLEAAIGPLSAPHPTPTRKPDSRTRDPSDRAAATP